MNTEVEIVRRRPFSFMATVIGQGLTPVATTLVAVQEKSFDEVSSLAWLVMVIGGIVSACQATRAWFSTSASKAREEIANGHSNATTT